MSNEIEHGTPQDHSSRRGHLRGLLFGQGLIGRYLYLVATQVVTVLLGAGYWAVTARLISANRVGVAAAAISAATLLGAIGVVGLTTSLLAVLNPLNQAERRELITTGVGVASGLVGLLAIGTWALSGVLGPSLGALGRNPVASLLFVIGAILTGATSIFDAAALGLSKSATRLARNTIASLLKVAFVGLVVATGLRTTTGLLVCWDASLALSLGVWPLLKLGRSSRISVRRRVELVQRYWRLSLGHHALNFALGSVTYFLPMVAALLVVPREVAYFTVAQLVAGSSLLLPFLLSMSLFVESTGNASILRRNIRKTFPVGVITCFVVLAVMEPGAHLILSIFGPQYAEHGTTPLRLLLLAGLPYVVKDHFMATRRAQNRLKDAAKFGMLASVAEVSAAALGGWLGGLNGLCGAWVLATLVVSLFFLSPVLRVLFGREPEHASAR